MESSAVKNIDGIDLCQTTEAAHVGCSRKAVKYLK